MKKILIILFTAVLVPLSVQALDEPYIVGGNTASRGEYPFIAALAYKGGAPLYARQFCGGVLISPEWVLTAAHCLVTESGSDVNPDDPATLEVYIGEYDLNNPTGVRRDIANIHVHPTYIANSAIGEGARDVALIELSEAVGSEYASVLNNNAYLRNGVIATVIGWGSTDGVVDVYPDLLHEVEIPIVSNDTCSAAMSPYTIYDYEVCAGYASGGKDSCSGDSGGPLLVNKNGGWVVAGIVSWGGDECARAGEYGIYARVADNLAWIEGYTGELDYGNSASSGGGGGGCSASANGNISLVLMFAALVVFIKRRKV